MSIVDWIEEFGPGRDRVAARSAARRRLQHRVRRGVERAELAQPRLPARLRRPGPAPRVREVGREVPRARRERPDPVAASARRLAGQITTGSELVAVKRTAAGAYTLSFKQGSKTKTVAADKRRARAPVLDRAALRRRLAGGLLCAQAAGDRPSRGWGRTRSSTSSSRVATGATSGSNGETYSDRGYQSTWEVSRAQPGQSGILVDYTGGTIGASFGSGTPTTRAQQFLSQIEPVLPGLSPVLEREGDDRLLERLPVDARLVLVLEGRSVHRLLGGRGPTGGERALLRRAHVDRLPGLPERRRRHGRAGGGRGDRRPRIARVGGGAPLLRRSRAPRVRVARRRAGDADVARARRGREAVADRRARLAGGDRARPRAGRAGGRGPAARPARPRLRGARGEAGVPHVVVPDELPDSPFAFVRVMRSKRWRESALWWPETRTLVVADALGTNRFLQPERRRSECTSSFA